ncbi:MAG: LegC family aminotransferase [Planctomycetota bacterium]
MPNSVSNLAENICQALEGAIGPASDHSCLFRPQFPATAWTYIKDCLDSGWVSSVGQYVDDFETKLAEYTGAPNAIAVVNGTAALQVCFHLAGVSHDDEVLMPALTFVATANAARHQNAHPHFIDIDQNHLGMCPEALEHRLAKIAVRKNGITLNRETDRRLAAVCPMHCLGFPCDLDALASICEEYDLPMVEDAAESLGSTYKGVHTGRHGLLSAISFNGNKVLTTGGGGAILTDNSDLAQRAKHLTRAAKLSHDWESLHDEVAWNYRMPNINAAMGVAQLEVLDELLENKSKLHDKYNQHFASIEELRLVQSPAWGRSNHWLNCIILEDDDIRLRDQILTVLNDAGYQSAPLWLPMHRLPMYTHCSRGDLPNTESIHRRSISIPSASTLAGHSAQDLLG